LNPQQLKERKEIGPAFDYALANLGKRGTGNLRFLFYFNKFWRSCRQTRAYVASYISKALQNVPSTIEKEAKPSRYILLNELVKATRDPAKIHAESLSILLAGRDTTASLLTIAFHVLSRYPSVEKKLREAIDQLNGELPSFEALKNLKYLRYFLDECKYLCLLLTPPCLVLNLHTLPAHLSSLPRRPQLTTNLVIFHCSLYHSSHELSCHC